MSGLCPFTLFSDQSFNSYNLRPGSIKFVMYMYLLSFLAESQNFKFLLTGI